MSEEDQDEKREIIPILQELKQSMKEVKGEIEEVKEELADADIYKPENNQKALEIYSEKRREEFWRRLKQSQSDGLEYADVGSIFDVRKSRSYELMKEIVRDYEKVGVIPYTGGGESQRLVHKKFYLIDLINQDSANLRKAINQRTGKQPGSHTWKKLLRLYVDEIRKREESKTVNKSKKREEFVEQAKEVCDVKDVANIPLD